MNDYFLGAVNQMIERGQRLIGQIPTGLPREFHLLSQKCRQEIRDILTQLRSLLDAKMLLPENQAGRLRSLKRVVAEMDFIEMFGVSALERADHPGNNTDYRLNQLIERIQHEIRYPLLPPVVISLSQNYFRIYPRLNLLLVPPREGDFLLHLPDLYHELAHPLFTERDNPRVTPFQESFLRFLDTALNYTEEQLQKEKLRRGPEQFILYLENWQDAWIKAWTVEFFCDLFAVYTLGPAFAWAHLHLSMKRGANPFSVPLLASSVSHPPDDARMRVMLNGLRLTGFEKETHEIEQRWTELLAICGDNAEPEYHRCFPDNLLEKLAVDAHIGTTAMGSRVATSQSSEAVHVLLNQAWTQFWLDPDGYAAWEKSAVEGLSRPLR